MEFEFTLEGPTSDFVVMPDETSITITVTSDGSGNITNGGSFDAIKFTAAGEYEFTVTEIEPDPAIPAVTYDTTPRTVTVTVVDNDGNLEVTKVTGLAGDEADADAAIGSDGEAEAVTEPDAPEVSDVPEETEGTENPDVTTGTEPGEEPGAAGTVISGAVEITNTYEPGPTIVVIPVEKTISGQTPPEDKTFTFILTPGAEGQPMPTSDTVTVTGAATGAFGPIEFTEVGTYTYTVTEQDDGETGYTYSTATHTVVVTVSDDASGELTASYVIDDDPTVERVVIDNPYAPIPTDYVIPVKKILTGPMPEGISAEFTFTLVGPTCEYVTMPAATSITIRVTGNGTENISNSGSYGAIGFTAAGEYTFTVTEIMPATPIPGMTYDTTPKTVTITVVDNDGTLEVTNVTGLTGSGTDKAVEITNSYIREVITGDDTNLVPYFVLMGVSGALLMVLAVSGRKQRKKRNSH